MKQIVRLIAKLPTLAACATASAWACRSSIPTTRSTSPTNFLSMMFKVARDDPFESDRSSHGARHPVHPARRPRAELLHHRDARRRLVARRSLLRPWPPRPPRCTARARRRQRSRAHACSPRSAATTTYRRLHRVGQAGQGAGCMGFGHRVYKSYDPRATIIKEAAYDVFEVTGKNPLLDIALKLEEVALDDEYFVSRKLYPNVDFYSGLIYQAMGFPVEMFTVLFAIPRTSGWLSHWQEMLEQGPADRAPRQLYIGAAAARLRRPRRRGAARCAARCRSASIERHCSLRSTIGASTHRAAHCAAPYSRPPRRARSCRRWRWSPCSGARRRPRRAGSAGRSPASSSPSSNNGSTSRPNRCGDRDLLLDRPGPQHRADQRGSLVSISPSVNVAAPPPIAPTCTIVPWVASASRLRSR